MVVSQLLNDKMMKKINYILVTLVFFCSTTISYGQQESTITQFKSLLSIFNPAAVSIDSATQININVRKQWTSIAEAPSTNIVSFGTHVRENVGIGFSVLQDKTFVEYSTFVGVDFSYKLKLSESSDIYLGIKAGGDFYELNTSGLETYNIISDPMSKTSSSFSANVGFGAYFKRNQLYASFSIPRLLPYDRAEIDGNETTSSKTNPHVYLMIGYDFVIKNSPFVIKPSVLSRSVKGSPNVLDINTMVDYNHLFEAGVTYRTNETIAGILQLHVNKRFSIGWVYEESNLKALANAGKTNEFLLKYTF